MVSNIRSAVSLKIESCSHAVRPSLSKVLESYPHYLSWCFRFGSKSSPRKQPLVLLPFQNLKRSRLIERTEEIEFIRSINQFENDEKFKLDFVNEKGLSIQVNSNYFNKTVLKDIINKKERYGFQSDLHKLTWRKDEGFQERKKETVFVEYSSPNIAKPFHAGHLRSTAIGNFVANINEALDNNVIRANYLGDWGTQFGLLGIAFEKYGSMTELQKDTLSYLLKLYIRINKELSDSDAESANVLQKSALEYFSKMEVGDTGALAFWEMCRKCSVDECIKMYKRLGISFDVYEGESFYHKAAINLVQGLKDQGLLKFHENGVGYLDLADEAAKKNLYANVIKSDGSTLYMTREISAAIARKEKYNFDRIHYVVENGQHLHFQQLAASLRKLGHTWPAKQGDQVKFGLVEGMSTRRGTMVLLSDILDEAQEIMVENMRSKTTTRVSSEMELYDIAEKLAVAAILVQDLRHRRLKNYKFDWQKMLQFKGDTGVFLQYTHCRLCSLEKACDVSIDEHCNIDLLQEPAAQFLIQHLAKFDEIVHEAYTELEAYYVTLYLFKLCHLLGRALEDLQVKGQPQDIAQARLLLFHCSGIVLRNGLRLLGIHPLTQM